MSEMSPSMQKAMPTGFQAAIVAVYERQEATLDAEREKNRRLLWLVGRLKRVLKELPVGPILRVVTARAAALTPADAPVAAGQRAEEAKEAAEDQCHRQ